jgi:MFS family permease
MPFRIFEAFHSLRHSTFSAFWWAALTSNTGTLIQVVAAAWLMSSLSTSATMVALVYASTALPTTLFSLLAGALADNVDRRRTMVIAQASTLLLSLILATIAYFGGLTPWLLLGLTFAIGAGNAFYNPCWIASISDLVPRSEVPAALSLNAIGNNLARTLGPAVGGIVVAVVGPICAFVINAASCVPLMVILKGWKTPSRDERLPREGLNSAIVAGLRFTVMSPELLKVLLRTFAYAVAATAALSLLPVVVRKLLSGNAFDYGVLYASYGFGAICTGLVTPWIRRVLSEETIIRCACMTTALSVLTLAWAPHIGISCLATALVGGSWLLSMTLFATTIQLSTPRWVLGRQISAFHTAVFGGTAAGSWVWGMLAEAFNVRLPLAVAAATMVALAAIGLLKQFALPETATLDLEPSDRWNEPQLDLKISASSGPVRVITEYVIPPDRTDQFLRLMAQRRRIRRRNGARHWTLARDLERSDHWLESCEFSTWTEYRRQAMRMTQADSAVGEALRSMHLGEAPRIRRMIEPPAFKYAADTGQP